MRIALVLLVLSASGCSREFSDERVAEILEDGRQARDTHRTGWARPLQHPGLTLSSTDVTTAHVSNPDHLNFVGDRAEPTTFNHFYAVREDLTSGELLDAIAAGYVSAGAADRTPDGWAEAKLIRVDAEGDRLKIEIRINTRADGTRWMWHKIEIR